jgi:glycosyltransferase involved in cell wall biosynthesis
VVPNPVVVRAPDSRPHDAPPVVAYTGRLVEEKGVHVLLDAARELPPGVRVRMTGSGRLAGALAARVRAENLPVDLLGPATPAQVAVELRRATVAVLPALWWENCPMAVLEAAAAGLPVVATAMGGIPELVEDGRTGLLVPPADSVTLARALTAVVSDPEEARRMGQAGRRAVRTRHDPEAHIAAVESAYRTAVEEATSRSSR